MSESQLPKDHCLQCGKSREQVRDYFDRPCATATGYETVETLDEWERHHWRDWSDRELDAAGILPEFYDQHRRDDVYALQYAPCEHQKAGHMYPRDSDPEVGLHVDQCLQCGHTREVHSSC